MAILYVKAGSSNTSPYDTWAKAATSLVTATAAAGTNDTIYVDSAFNETGLTAANATYTLATGVRVISASSAAEPPTTYVTGGATVQTTTTNAMTCTGNGSFHGMVLKVGSGGSSATLNCGTADNMAVVFEDCTLQVVGTGTGGRIAIGVGSGSTNNTINKTRNCTFIFANASQGIGANSPWYDEGSTIAGSGTVPTTLITVAINASIEWNGTNLAAVNTTLVGNTAGWVKLKMTNCKTHASVTPLNTSAPDGSAVWMFDCDSGDVQYTLKHYDNRGSTVQDTGIYLTNGVTVDGSTHVSWKIVTTANASRSNPYFSPWFDKLSSTGSAITPTIECARDGSATKYTDAELWGEFMVKNNTGFPYASYIKLDMATPVAAGTAQATGVGTGSWTGLSGTACSMALDTAGTVTPAEVGYMRARVGMAVASATVYAEPDIRGI